MIDQIIQEGDKVEKIKYSDGTVYTVIKVMNGHWNMMLVKSDNPEHENAVLVRQNQFKVIGKRNKWLSVT